VKSDDKKPDGVDGACCTYATATGPLLSSHDALRAVLEYAEDFITTGDVDVMHTLSGGSIMVDGNTVDPAIWADWAAAWARAASQVHTKRADVGSAMLTMQHGFRAFHVFLDRHYQPTDETPMSAVRDDCRRALAPDGDTSGRAVRDNWLRAVEDGASADISFQLESGRWLILREVWRLIKRKGADHPGEG